MKSTTPNLNPVERQFFVLRERWELFRDRSPKRLLIWLLPENAMQLAHAFFEAQQHELPYASGDLFIVFDPAFENSIQYSRQLKEMLAGRYQASREDLEREGIAPDWTFTPADAPDSAQGFIQGLDSFANHHPDIGHVVAVLTPASVSSVSALSAWVRRMLSYEASDRLRYILLDSSENPRFSEWDGGASSLAHVDSMPFDSWQIARETFAQEPTSGPAGMFRLLLTGVFMLVEKGSADQVMERAGEALAFARRQGWQDQEVAVRMLTAGSMLKEKRFGDAVSQYRHARKAALELAASNRLVSQQLTLQSWFGEAGAHFCAGDAIQAARCYDSSVTVAESIPSVVLWIEGLRMSAYSYLQANQPHLALERGLRILDVGRQLAPAERMSSTLPFALVGLLRLIEPERVRALESIKHQLDEERTVALRVAERGAAELESDSQGLQRLEKTHATRLERLRQEAKRQQAEIAAQADEPFARVFRRTNELLGPGWLIDSPAAILPAPSEVAAKRGGIAS